MITKPTIKQEKKLLKKGYKYILCLDEAGRGSLAGPVFASGVLILWDKNITRNKIFKELLKLARDSKLLTPLQREKIYEVIKKADFIVYSVSKVGVSVIDRINIKNASEKAMENCVKKIEKKIKRKVDIIIADGDNIKNEFLNSKNCLKIVKADRYIFTCALSSIIAKVERDRYMEKLNKMLPRYDFAKNKGYGTKEHLKAIKKYGLSKVHRKSFLKNL